MALLEYFGNPTGLWALVSVIGLLILYLIYRQPRTVELPSIRFLEQGQEQSESNALLQRLNLDVLFFLNLLLLLALSLAVAQPHIPASGVQTEEPVIAIDTSASMQAKNSLAAAKSEAQRYLGQSNTIVTYDEEIQVLAEDVGEKRARSAIENIEINDVADAPQTTLTTLQSLYPRRSIFLVSDFRNQAATTLQLPSSVQPVPINAEEANRNAGIIDATIQSEQLRVVVKNYNMPNTEFSLNTATQKHTFALKQGQQTAIEMPLPNQSTRIRLQPTDALKTDNVFHYTQPEQRTINAIVVSDGQSPFISSALEAMPFVSVSYTDSLNMPDSYYDVYVLTELNASTFTQGQYTDLLQYVDEGALLTVYAWEDMRSVSFDNTLPITKGPLQQDTVRIQGKNLLSDIDFRTANAYFNSTARSKAISLARTGTNTSIIAYQSRGAGNIAYYGILDNASSFPTGIQYPVVWKQLLQALTAYEKSADIHLKAGDTFRGERLTNTGFHTVGDTQVAVNLLNTAESDITQSHVPQQSVKTQQTTKMMDITSYVLIFAGLLVLSELLYVWWRGDFA